jgi:hypothetical protein
MTEAELHANYERAITRQLEELVAIIVRYEGEIERLRAERDALLSHCIDEAAPKGKLRDKGYTHQVFDGWAVSRPGAADEDAVPVMSCHHSHAEAVAAARRVAGLDPEAAP